jgi:hypothetical protein
MLYGGGSWKCSRIVRTFRLSIAVPKMSFNSTSKRFPKTRKFRITQRLAKHLRRTFIVNWGRLKAMIPTSILDSSKSQTDSDLCLQVHCNLISAAEGEHDESARASPEQQMFKRPQPVTFHRGEKEEVAKLKLDVNYHLQRPISCRMSSVAKSKLTSEKSHSCRRNSSRLIHSCSLQLKRRMLLSSSRNPKTETFRTFKRRRRC